MAAKKRKRAKRVERTPKPVPVAVLDVPTPVPVAVLAATPRRSPVTLIVNSILLVVLFVVGLVPLGIWAFTAAVLRQHADPNPWIIGLGVLVSLVVANVADDKISKSAKDVAGATRGFLRFRNGGGQTSEQRAAGGGDGAP